MPVVSLLFHDVYAASPRESGFESPAADRYKLSVRAFEAQLDGLARGGSESPTVLPPLITFDDGGASYYTIAAERLEARGWRGHCFVSTDFINQRGFLTTGQLRELAARGHVIGSHSASHPSRFSSLSPDAMRREWSNSRQALEDLLGHPVTVGSVPGGYFSRGVAQAAADAGLRVLFTSEPVRSVSRAGHCLVMGRFTIRNNHHADMARRFVAAPWARRYAWLEWNAKGVVKPLLGSSYARIADWFLTRRVATHHG